MSEAAHGNRRRTGSDWVVQPLEGRALLNAARVSPPVSPAQVSSDTGLTTTTVALQAATVNNAVHPKVSLVATVYSPDTKRPVSAGRVRYSVVAPGPEFLGVAHPDARGSVTLTTTKLTRGHTYVIQAHYVAPNAAFAPSSTTLDVSVGAATASRLLITAPQYYGAPGFPVTFNVTALDRAGHTVSNYTGTVQFVSPTDHSAKFLSRTYSFTPADQGTHSFPDGVTFHKGGAEILEVRQVNNTSVSGSQAFGIE